MTHWKNLNAKTTALLEVQEQLTEAGEFVVTARANTLMISANSCCWQLKHRNSDTMSTKMVNTIISCIK
jgi:hypothetical protein